MSWFSEAVKSVTSSVESALPRTGPFASRDENNPNNVLGSTRTQNGLGQYWNGREWVTGGTPETLYGFNPTTTPGASATSGGQYTRSFNGLGYWWDPGIGGWRVGSPPGQAAAPSGQAAATGPASPGIEDRINAEIGGNRERTLELLRQRLMGQQNQNVASLRQQLAQRGLLDSGNLGYGTAMIGNRISDLLSQGSLLAGNTEGEQRLGELLAQQGNIWQAARDRALAGYDWNRMMEQNRQQTREREGAQQWQQSLQPTWWESALGNLTGGLGQGFGTAGGQALAQYLMGGQ